MSAHAAVGYGFDGGRPARVTAKPNVKLGWLGEEEHDAPRCHIARKEEGNGGGDSSYLDLPSSSRLHGRRRILPTPHD